MSSNGKTYYVVRNLAVVGEQIKDLAKRAAAHGQKFVLLSVVLEILHKLQTEPSKWGDPDYNLHTPGACVYHGILDPLIAQYAIPDKVVLLKSLKALPTASF
jgi:hypothetical protein